MSSGTVKSTEEAIQATIKMKSIINGPFQESIDILEKSGTILSYPNYWSGSLLASQFRSDQWPRMKTALKILTTQLEEQRARSHQIELNMRGDEVM